MNKKKHYIKPIVYQKHKFVTYLFLIFHLFSQPSHSSHHYYVIQQNSVFSQYNNKTMIKRTYTCSVAQQIRQFKSRTQPSQSQPPLQQNLQSSNTNNNNHRGNPYLQKLEWLKNHANDVFAGKLKAKKKKSYRKDSTQSAIVDVGHAHGSDDNVNRNRNKGFEALLDSELILLENGKLGSANENKKASLFYKKSKTAVQPQPQKIDLTKSLTIFSDPNSKTSPQSSPSPSITSQQSSSFKIDQSNANQKQIKIDNETLTKMQNNLMQFYNFYIQQKIKMKQMRQMFLKSVDHQLLRELENKIQQAQQNRNKELEILNNAKLLKIKIDKEVVIQEQQIQKEIIHVNMELLKLIADHAQYRNLIKTTANLQQKVQEVKLDQVLNFQKEEQEIVRRVGQVKEENCELMEKICGIEKCLEQIKNLRGSLSYLRQNLQCNKNMKNELQNIYDQIIQQHSSKNIKQELQNSIKWHNSGQSNAQILNSFHKNIQKKLSIIQSALNTYSQKHKMIACLQLKQQQTPSLFLTRESNKFTIQQQEFCDQNLSQFKIYQNYLQSNEKTNKLLQKFDAILKNYTKSKLQRKKQIEQLKKNLQDHEAKIKELDGIQKIRDAQIKQLYQIWQQKMKKMNLFKVQRDSFDIFRNSFTSFNQMKKSTLQNQLNQSRSSNYWFQS